MEDEIGTIDIVESETGSAEGPSEQDVQHIQEEARLKQVAQELKRSKAINLQFAKFLSFLLQQIDQEEIINMLYTTFFITTDPKTQISYLRKNPNTIVICGFFYPFYEEEAKKYNLHQIFQKLLPSESTLTIKGYLTYLQQVSNTYHDHIPIDQGNLLHLIVLIVKYYLSNAEDALGSNESLEEYRALIHRQLS